MAQLFIDAHTARTFLDEPVTDAQIEALYEMMKWAPTTMNIQPLRLIIARSDATRAQVLEHLGGSNREQAEAAPLITVVCADTNFHDTLSEVVLTSRMLESSSSMTNGVKQLLDTKRGCNLGTS